MKTVQFSTLPMFARFYTNGVAYNKSGKDTCVDDYSLNPIHVYPDTEVEIKS